MLRWLLTYLTLSSLLSATPLKIATLHPLLSELAQEIGQQNVQITSLIKPGQNLHDFSPSPADLTTLNHSQLIVASGMNLESFLPALKNSTHTPILALGDQLPPRHLQNEQTCTNHQHQDHQHSHHQTDPHWWHSIPLMIHATQILSNSMAQLAPEHATQFLKNARTYRQKLRTLDQSIRAQLAPIPTNQRILATSHAAFGYYCQEYQLTPIPLAGLTPEQTNSASTIQTLIQLLQKYHVHTVFPEKESNPKLLQAITRDSHFKLGSPLIADATDGTPYLQILQQNTSAILQGLTQQTPKP